MAELHNKRKTSRLTLLLGYVSGIILFFMMALTVLDVFLRYFFNKPLLGLQEITEFMLVTFVFFSLPYALAHDDHIRVDFVLERFPIKIQQFINPVILSLSIALLLAITVMGILKGFQMKEANYISSILSIPVYPFYFVVSLGAFAMAFESFLKLIDSLGRDVSGS
jgi:TRAP-type C4-dicarboxylate transport system permease small subunit